LLWASRIRSVMQEISSCSKLSARVGTMLVEVRHTRLTLGLWILNLSVNLEQWHSHPSLICNILRSPFLHWLRKGLDWLVVADLEA
jgi:hypothetical protein